MAGKLRPQGYVAYLLLAKERGQTPDTQLAQCDARYRFARNLETVVLDGFSEQAQTAYTSALRVALAYSALEPLKSARNLHGKLSVRDQQLADAFRSLRLTRFREFLMNNEQATRVQKPLQQLIDSPNSSDVLPVVLATRHIMFHGGLNPTASGITTKTATAFLDNLATAVFREIDTHMLQHLQEFRKSHKKN